MEKVEQTYKLPVGWIWTNVSELFVIIGGGTPTKNNSRYWGGNINWASVKDIKSQYILTTEDKITTEGVESSSTKIANAGDVVLVTRISPGQVSIVKSNTAINQDLKILKLFGGMNPSFVYFLLLSQNQQFLKNASGTTVKGIKVNSLKNIVLPLPPLQEQHRIVSKIDTLFSELDHAEKGLQNVKHQLGIYKQALLKSAFNGSITAKWRAENEEKSAYEELESIKRIRKKRYNLEIQQGNKRKIKTDYNITFKQDEEIPTWVNANLNNLIDINARIGWRGLTKKEYTTEGPLFLSVHSLNYGKNVVFNDANHITNARYEESPEIKLQVNDLLLCKDGAGIGKVGIIKSLPDKATVNSSLLVINAKEVFNPDFLYYFFSGPTMQELVNDKISGSAIPHLFQKDIKKFNLKVPPKEEQNEIVDVLESRFTLVENLEKSINDSLSKALVFRHSILKKAFEGKLVEQNPNDEPAELLLQKIKKEKGEFLTVQKVIDKLIPKKKRHMEAKKTVFEILRELKEPISTQELWTNSIHEGDIESFYSEIKEIYDQLDEMKESTESFLSLKK